MALKILWVKIRRLFRSAYHRKQSHSQSSGNYYKLLTVYQTYYMFTKYLTYYSQSLISVHSFMRVCYRLRLHTDTNLTTAQQLLL